MTAEATEPVGYQSALEKTLGLRSVVLFGLAYMAPIIVLGIFGVIAVKSNGGSGGSYLLATIAMLFTALSYGLMAKHFPISGSVLAAALACNRAFARAAGFSKADEIALVFCGSKKSLASGAPMAAALFPAAAAGC